MTLSEPLSIVLASLIAAAVSIFIYWRQSRSPMRQRRTVDQWQRYAQQLSDRKDAQTERTIGYLEATIENQARTIAELQAEVRGGGRHD